MKRLVLAVALVFSFGAVVAQADSPGTPGPTMYTLEEIYNYIESGTVATEGEHSMEPPSGATPGDTRFKTLKDIYELLEEQYSQSAGTTVADVRVGKRFICANPGSWGVQTGTFYCAPTPTPIPTNTPTNTPVPTNTPIPTNTPTPTTTATPTIIPTPQPTSTPLPYVMIGGMMVPRTGASAGRAYNGTKNWATAVSWANGLNWIGYTDWHLPTKDEMLTICQNKSQLDDYPTTENVWSSTDHPSTNYYYRIWCCCGANASHYSDALRVFAVR